MIYLMFGPPASGKGTQAQMLAETLHLPFYSVGAELRKASTENKTLADRLALGKLAPRESIMRVYRTLHSEHPDKVIIDGAFRSPEQVQDLLKLWDSRKIVLIWIEVADAIIRERAKHRTEAGSKRDDDDPKVVEERIKTYRYELPFIMEQLGRKRISIISVDGAKSVKSVHETILKKLSHL